MERQYFDFAAPYLFQNRAVIRPNKIAVRDGKRTLTFRELEVRSNALLLSSGLEVNNLGIFQESRINLSIRQKTTACSWMNGCFWLRIPPHAVAW